jgi:hypothetical protein
MAQDASNNQLAVLVDTRQKPPEIPEEWDCELSIINTKSYLIKWKTLTLEMATELYIAREKLRAQGKRTDLETTSPKLLTWGKYCDSIGVSKRVVNRWLATIFGEIEQELLNEGEVTDIKDINTGVIVDCSICGKKYIMFHREKANKDSADHRLEEYETSTEETQE